MGSRTSVSCTVLEPIIPTCHGLLLSWHTPQSISQLPQPMDCRTSTTRWMTRKNAVAQRSAIGHRHPFIYITRHSTTAWTDSQTTILLLVSGDEYDLEPWFDPSDVYEVTAAARLFHVIATSVSRRWDEAVVWPARGFGPAELSPSIPSTNHTGLSKSVIRSSMSTSPS